MNIYLIPGLAADARVFHRIRLPEGHQAVPMDWIKPVVGESLPSYARRMAESIDSASPFGLVGLSFGGMIASEISRIKTPKNLILLSSIPSPSHLPPYFKSAGTLKLDQALPIGLLKKGIVMRRLMNWNGRTDRHLIEDIVRQSDPEMIRWSMRAILEWKADPPPIPFAQIHGSRDLVLPIRYTKPTHIVPGAGHMMVMDKAEEINRLLQEILQEAS